jgi:hypothetical protein
MEVAPTANQGYWDSVPHEDEETESARHGGRPGKAMPGYGTFKLPRRSLLKTAGVLGTALAINVVSSLPEKWVPKAFATVGTEYTSCSSGGYAYDDSAKICTGAEESSSYCGSDGWFKNQNGGTVNYWPITQCGVGVTQKNAWRWPKNGVTYRCADGKIQYGSVSPIFVICLKAL